MVEYAPKYKRSSGKLVEYRTQISRMGFKSHRGSFTNNQEQLANLLYVQFNSAFYPQWEGKRVLAYGRRGEGRTWLLEVIVCLLAALRIQLFASTSKGWPHINAQRYH